VTISKAEIISIHLHHLFLLETPGFCDTLKFTDP
jgi:hypothetical protein